MQQTDLEMPNVNPPSFVPQKLTYEDFLREYDGQYAEFVDDEVIIPMSVTKAHNAITHFLAALLQLFVESKRLGEIYGEPYQMRMVLEGKIKGREPDVFFVRKENLDRLGEKFYDGAADLVVEVISPDSILRDTQEKFEEYEAAGVEEYWIIDPLRRTANFYGYDDNRKYKLLHLTAEGVFESRVIGGLWINTEWLWQDELPKLMDVLKEWKLS